MALNSILKLINHVNLGKSNTSTINNNINKTCDGKNMKLALTNRQYMSSASWTFFFFTLTDVIRLKKDSYCCPSDE